MEIMFALAWKNEAPAAVVQLCTYPNLVEDCSISIANALGALQSSTKQSICSHDFD